MSAGLSYVFGPSDKIVETEGVEITNAKVQHHTLTLSAEYVTPLPRLSVEAELPFMGTKWDDSSLMHAPMGGEWDDGELHFTPTDLRAGLSYDVLQEPVQLEVSLAGSIPVTDYPTFGYTAPARGLKALHAGVTVSRTLDPLVPRLFLIGSYEFALVEKYDEIPEAEEFGQNYSEFSAQVGYLITDRFEAHGAFQGHIHHDGMDFIDWNTYSPEVQMNHDGILKERSYFLGAGLGYQITDALSVGADVRFFVGGANTRNANLFGVALAYQIL